MILIPIQLIIKLFADPTRTDDSDNFSAVLGFFLFYYNIHFMNSVDLFFFLSTLVNLR